MYVNILTAQVVGLTALKTLAVLARSMASLVIVGPNNFPGIPTSLGRLSNHCCAWLRVEIERGLAWFT